MGCVTNRRLIIPMYGLAIQFQRNGSGGRKRDDWSVLAMVTAVNSSMVVSIHVQLGEEREFIVIDVFVLVAFDVGVLRVNVRFGDCSYDCLDNIPVRLED